MCVFISIQSALLRSSYKQGAWDLGKSVALLGRDVLPSKTFTRRPSGVARGCDEVTPLPPSREVPAPVAGKTRSITPRTDFLSTPLRRPAHQGRIFGLFLDGADSHFDTTSHDRRSCRVPL